MNVAPEPTLLRIPMRTLSRQTRYALEGVTDVLVYKIAMTTRFRGVTRREGLLLRGQAWWGEAAPFWNYDDAESSRWLAAALESARRFPPVARRKFVPVNVTIPVVSPEDAHERVIASGGCATAKIKVAEPGVSATAGGSPRSLTPCAPPSDPRRTSAWMRTEHGRWTRRAPRSPRWPRPPGPFPSSTSNSPA